MAWLPQLKLYLPALVTTVAIAGILIFADRAIQVASSILVPFDIWLIYRAAYKDGKADGTESALKDVIQRAAAPREDHQDILEAFLAIPGRQSLPKRSESGVVDRPLHLEDH